MKMKIFYRGNIDGLNMWMLKPEAEPTPNQIEKTTFFKAFSKVRKIYIFQETRGKAFN